jgi:hypothetical protein
MNLELKRKYRSLVEKLYLRTKEEKISWKWDVDDKKVTARIFDQYVDILKGVNANFEDLYTISVFGSTGYLVEQFNDEMIGGPSAHPKISGFESYYLLISALYDLAYRQSIGADKALDTLLLKLDEDDMDSDDLPF